MVVIKDIRMNVWDCLHHGRVRCDRLISAEVKAQNLFLQQISTIPLYIYNLRSFGRQSITTSALTEGLYRSVTVAVMNFLRNCYRFECVTL